MRSIRFLAILLPVAVNAAIPLSKQHPLIARVDQLYSWSISPLTFNDEDPGSISIQDSPGWLIYDNATSTFRGRPTSEDIGTASVHLRNKLGARDHFPLWVTDLLPPIVNIPVASQLVPGNPSISSGFTFPAPGAGVRVPPKWSFSIGFDGYTFITPDERTIFYDATLNTGLPLPDWVIFNNRSLTFDGVAPPENRAVSLSIILYGSDRWGFGAVHQQFDLVVGPGNHILGVDGTGGLETVNVTGGAPFTHLIEKFGGLVIDGVQVVASNVSHVDVNLSSVPWISFDETTRVLAGFPPTSVIGQPPLTLPVSITSDYNDTIGTNISIAVFPSYFTATPILPVPVHPGAFLTFSIRDYFSHARNSSATIVPQFIPHAASSWLKYDNLNDTINGFAPRSTIYDEVNVTFYATDMETHAVSTLSMLLSIASDKTSGPEVWDHLHGSDTGTQAKTAIIVTFSVIGGAILLCCMLALCRHYCGAREPREDDEGTSQWKYRDVASPDVQLSEKMLRSIGLSRTSATTDESSENASKLPISVLIPSKQMVVDSRPQARTMKKVRFFQHLLTPSKRKLRDQGLGSQSGNIRISQISRPTPIDDEDKLRQMSISHTESGSRLGESGPPSKFKEQRVANDLGVVSSVPSFGWPKVGPIMRGPDMFPFESSTQVTPDRSSQAPSESDGSSLTSIPRRRSDFLPPRNQRAAMSEQTGDDSYTNTFQASASSRMVDLEHGEAVVISTAARQTVATIVSTTSVPQDASRSSVDSESSSLTKHQSLPGSPGSMCITGVRTPRLVQLNSERRVPTKANEGASTVRNISQKVIVTGASNGHPRYGSDGESGDDQRLSHGIHYVSGLGDEDGTGSAVFYMTPSVGKPSPTCGKPSFSANETTEPSATRPMLVKPATTDKISASSRQQLNKIPIGAPFAISVQFETIPARGAALMVRQQNGDSAPGWVNLDQRDVELWGVPLKEHRGTHLLEIVETTGSGQRVVARMGLDVVDWE